MLTITEEQLKEALARLCRTEDGRVVLRYLMAQCGYNRSSVSVNEATRDINLQAMLYDEARRGLWLSMRRYIDRDSLIAIEHPEQNKSKDEENAQWLAKQEQTVKEQSPHKGVTRQAQKRLEEARLKREAAEQAIAQAQPDLLT